MPEKKRKPILPMTQERINLFWSRVAILGPDDCWPWTGGKDTNGYGAFQPHEAGVDARTSRTNRSHCISFALSNRKDPIAHVCHSCDNPPCCNPKHLFDGTHRDNSVDMWKKGRAKIPHPRLTHAQVIEIRNLYPPPTDKLRPRGKGKYTDGTQRYIDVAIKYGIDASTVERIANRKIWRHV